MIIKLALLAGLAAVAVFIGSGIRFSQARKAGRTRDQRTNAEAVNLYRSTLALALIARAVPAGAFNLPAGREDLSDGAPPIPKTLEQWLAEDERILLRAEVSADLAWWSGWELRSDARARASSDKLARSLLGYADGITGLRADQLIASCHNSRAELVERINVTCEWPQEWEDELAELLAGTQSERVSA